MSDISSSSQLNAKSKLFILAHFAILEVSTEETQGYFLNFINKGKLKLAVGRAVSKITCS